MNVAGYPSIDRPDPASLNIDTIQIRCWCIDCRGQNEKSLRVLRLPAVGSIADRITDQLARI